MVTGIGHEIDFTIADFVADLRAPTPSAAAQLVVPDASVWLHRLEQLAARFAAAARRTLRSEQTRLDGLLRRLQQAHPGARLLQHSQRLDELEVRLRLAIRGRLAAQRHGAAQQQRLQALQGRLALRCVPAWPPRPPARQQRACAAGRQPARHARSRLCHRHSQRRWRAGHRSAQLRVGESIDARLASGSVRATVLERRS